MRKSENCPFCNPPDEEIAFANELAFVRRDKYPVSKGHYLIITYRHIESIFDATKEELGALWKLVQATRESVEKEYVPDGFNIGINNGIAAGQSVSHMHIHLIPRYVDDVPEPLGGIRGVIPEKQRY